jgi:DNA mismatch repair protein MutL
LDAGATHISVIVRGAGKQLLHVVDNGKGMSKTDLLLAPKRHATSKIRTSEDLERILTLGFRGEALASISSVAHIEIRSRRVSDEIGTKLLSEPLQEPVLEPCAMEIGTQIFVRNLFYNVPARRKFMRSDLTEFRHIAETMTRFVLSRPNVRFTFYDDDNLVYDLAATTTKQRIVDALGSRFADALMQVDFSDEVSGSPLHFWGFVGQAQFAKKTKSEQFFYLNGRAISSRQLSHAVMSAYEHQIDHSSYPPFVLFIEMNPERVDINIHPQKHEVKFDDDRTIYSAIRRAVSSTLSKHNLAPSASFRPSQTAFDPATAPSVGTPFERMTLSPRNPSERGQDAFVNTNTGEVFDSSFRRPNADEASKYAAYPTDARERGLFPQEQSAYEALFGRDDVFSQNNTFANKSPQARNDEASGQSSYVRTSEQHDAFGKNTPSIATMSQSAQGVSQSGIPHGAQKFYWQLHKKYVLSPSQNGLTIIDQHAAHERILYERALRAMNEGFAYGQELLFPVTMHCTSADAALVEELKDDLAKMGFEINTTTPQQLEIRAVPADVRTGREEDALRELLEQYREYNELRHTSARDNLAASFGCRSAIRTGDLLTLQEMRGLVDDLYATQMPYACPHGRPIIIEIPLEELDRRFGRTS